MEGGDICMSSIDERVVEMNFDNGKFENGVKTTLGSLGKLKEGLNLGESAKSLSDLQGAGDRFNLSHIADGVQNMSSKFTALGVVGVTALANIANSAVNAGKRLVSSLTIDPIKSGLDEYNTNLNSVQTILANTQSSGATLGDVNGALQQLNLYSDKTIYNFSEMARNIGTFTAAGVGLKESVSSIKGISNLAALSGSNSQQASTAMYQLSQAISSGKVGLQDWNSVVNAGMGGTVFQRALATTASKMGTLEKSSVKLVGPMKNVKIAGESFRDSISAKGGGPSWLTSDVLTKTLNQFTGDMTDAQLAAEGFSKAEIKNIKEQADSALKAATVVKTLPALIGTLQESAGSGWSSTWQIVFGDFEEAKTLFTNVNRAIGPLINNASNARNKMLQDWKNDGGRTAVINGIANAFHTLMNIVGMGKKAFQDIIPPVTGKMLTELSLRFEVLTQRMMYFVQNNKGAITNTFKGLFAVLDIGRMIVTGLIKTIAGLFGGLGGGVGSVLDITGAIGKWLVALDEAIKNGDGLTKFFDGLGAVLQVPIKLIGIVIGALAALAKGLSISGDAKGLQDLGAKMTPLSVAATLLKNAWSNFAARISGVFQFVAPIVASLGTVFSNLGKAIADSIQTGDFNHVLDVVNTGLLGGIVLLVKKFLKGGFKFKIDVGASGLGKIFEGVTGSLEAMQQNLKANVLLKIAGAIGILTLSIVALSGISPGDLTKSLTAITVMFVQLGAALTVFDKISGAASFAKMPVFAASLILLAIAIDVLASAAVKLAGLDWNELARGLTGVVVLLGAIAGTSALMKNTAKNLIPAGLGMIAIAIAVNILAKAVGTLGSMDIASLASGLGAIAVIMASVAGFTRIVDPKKLAASATSMVILGVALNLMAKAVQTLGSMPIDQLALGLGALAIGLGIIAGALRLIPVTLVAQAAAIALVAGALILIAQAMTMFGGMSWEEVGRGLVVLAGSLGILAGALVLMQFGAAGAPALIIAAAALAVMAGVMVVWGNMDWENIGKSMVVLAGSLLIISGALYLMTAALPGAVALVVAAGALAVLAPVMVVLGGLSWQAVATGLVAIAGALAIIGVAGLVLTPVIPSILGLGIAVAALGIGLGAAGIGILALSAGLTAIGIAGASAGVGLAAMIAAILGTVPMIISVLGDTIVQLAQVIIKGAPAVVDAFIAILLALIKAIDRVVPPIIKTATHLISAFIGAIVTLVPQIVSAGLKIVVGILQGISNNIGRIVTVAGQIIVRFLQAIGQQLPKIADAGAKLVIKFVNSIADAIRNNTQAMKEAGGNLASAIIDGMTSGIRDGLDAVIHAATGIGGAALDAVKAILGIHSPSKEFKKVGEFVNEGFIEGLTGTQSQVESAFDKYKDLISSLLDSSAADIASYGDKITAQNEKIAKDTKAITDQQKKVNETRRYVNSGAEIDKQTVKLSNLTATRAKDQDRIEKLTKASKASYKKDGDAKRAQARIDLRSAKAALASNAQAIKDTKTALHKAKADKKNGKSVKEQQDKLNALTDARGKDQAQLTEYQNAQNDASSENARAQAATDALNTSLAAQQAQLDDLAGTNDQYTKDIEEQAKKVDDAQKALDDYNKSIRDQYSAQSDITKDTELPDYFEKLTTQIEDTMNFTSQLAELRKRGLNDESYRKFLSEGTEISPFLTQLLDQGGEGVSRLNDLTTQLDNAAGGLGSTASRELYQAGVDAATGLLQGLSDNQTAIQAQMRAIANSMLLAVQGTLDIHSPSRKFKALGQYANDGLVAGLKGSASNVTDAASGVGDEAINGLRNSLAGIAKAVATDMDFNPTIRPVLDLSAVQSQSGQLTSMLNPGTLQLQGAYMSAISADNGYRANQEAILAEKSSVATERSGDTIFNQYNNSPKSLSPTEIYRQTKNQLSQAKGGNK
jgi:tape measure domain-containing protein